MLRVAIFKNDGTLNEELDKTLMIQKIRREVQQLREELAMATGEQRTDELSEDLIRCEQAGKVYLADFNPDAIVSVGADMRKVHSCYRIMKKGVGESSHSSESSDTHSAGTRGSSS